MIQRQIKNSKAVLPTENEWLLVEFCHVIHVAKDNATTNPVRLSIEKRHSFQQGDRIPDTPCKDAGSA
jgi:hypothetical protein